MSSIEELWKRLEAWGQGHAPKMLEDLNPGAPAQEIAALEQTIGRSLPEDFRQSLGVHDGESDGWPSKVFADQGAYLSCSAIAENWSMRQQVAAQGGQEFSDEEIAEQISSDIITVEGPVRPRTFDAAWIPIMDCNGDVFWALDFAPAEGGAEGQVIQVDLEGTYWRVVATSFESFLTDYVAALEAGSYEIDAGLPTQEPSDPEADRRAEAVHDAFLNSLDTRQLSKQPPGSEVEIVGYRDGVVRGDRCSLQIAGGTVRLRGSLRGSNFNQILRVRIRVGRRRAIGLLGPIHEIVSWEFVDER